MTKQSVFATLLLAVGLVPAGAAADRSPPPRPGADARCAVCGMAVARTPDWVATVVLDDGRMLYFDGAKDMFKLLLDPAPHGIDPEQVASVWVTDYYTTRQVPAEAALFVVGSDVTGPMGAELVPVAGAEAAATFAADHGAVATLRFADVGIDDLPR